MENSPLEHALTKALTVLGSLNEENVRQLSLLNCTFMLGALPSIEPLAATRQLLADRLRAQVSHAWVEQGDAYQMHSVLSSLWKYDSTYVSGDWLACAVKRLVRSEATVGGPYYTGSTIAVAANAQIAIFINLVASPLPNMERFITDVIAAERFDDSELTGFGLLYLLATAGDYDGLRRYVQARWQQDKTWQTPWHRVVALAALKDSVQNPEIRQVLLAVCKQQRQDGLWNGEPLLKAAPMDQQADLVTTALIVEALGNYLYTPARNSQVFWRRKHQVAQAAARRFKTHPEPLRSTALAAIKKVCNADDNFEITLLPQFFAYALDDPHRLTNAHCTKLGLANLCAWIAYTIYDDFIDSEGQPVDLPVANVAMRASLDCFRKVLPDDSHFQEYVAEVFDGMDDANAWEVAHCRFVMHDGKVAIAELPKYGKCTVLAARSFAHALTPMAVLAEYAPHSAKKMRHIETAFQHYLIARQLNDDLHDWVKDMQAGQASYVVTAILRDLRVKNDVYDLSTLMPAMQRCFRGATMSKICQRMLWHIAQSRQHFIKSQLLQPSNDIYILLDNLELSAHHSMDKQAKSQALANIHAA